MRIFILTFLLLCMNTVFPSERIIDIYIIGGQSNATGQAIMRNIPQSFKKDTTVNIFYSRYLNRGKGGECWQNLCQASDAEDKFGVELSLGTKLKEFFPEKEIALIKHSLSGSNLYDQWNPGNRKNERQGDEYRKWINTVNLALSQLRKMGYKPILRAMVWQQGEADARDWAGMKNSMEYGKNLRNFITQVRKDLNSPDLLFVYGKVIPIAAKRFPGRDLIRQAQYDISEASKSSLSVKNTILIETDDLQMLSSDFRSPAPKDDVHLGTYGILELGERFAKAIYKHQTKK